METNGYEFRIEETEGAYVFRLYPNNNKQQPIGESAERYANKALCRKALDLFREVIKTNQSADLLKIKKISDTKFLPYLEKDIVIFNRTIAYEHESQAHIEWPAEIWNNINAPLK